MRNRKSQQFTVPEGIAPSPRNVVDISSRKAPKQTGMSSERSLALKGLVVLVALGGLARMTSPAPEEGRTGFAETTASTIRVQVGQGENIWTITRDIIGADCAIEPWLAKIKDLNGKVEFTPGESLVLPAEMFPEALEDGQTSSCPLP